ncbi:MAG: hypothetical protein VB035_00865 [Candidatus Fimivivens sp.]|nr:hypothetical protein [Candidatus Fimivivens sp.]
MGMKAIQFADGVRQLYIPKLNTVSEWSTTGLRGWLADTDNFVPNQTGQSDHVELALYDVTESLVSWAGDIARLACASLETVKGITQTPGSKKFLAWQLVEYYYSAFYAAHCTLKICNFGLIQLDNRIINNIKRRANTLGTIVPNTFCKGIYCANIQPTLSKIILYKVQRYDDSHRGLWQRYADFLNVLSGISIVTGTVDSNCVRKRNSAEGHPQSIYSQMPLLDAQLLIERIDEVKRILNNTGDFNWLSSIRNAINYNHSFGIWYPYKAFRNEYEKLLEMNNLHLQNPLDPIFNLTDEVDLSQFVKCCQLINSINRELIIDLSSRHPESKSFLNRGPLKYIKLQRT